MICSQCGALNGSTAHLCKNCGASFAATEPPEEQTDILYSPEIPQQFVNPFATLLFWGALLLVLGFFLPWVSLGGFLSYNGWSISGFLMRAGSTGKENGTEALLYSLMLYLMPVASLIVLVALFGNAGKTLLKLFKLVPVLIIFSFTAISIAKSDGKFEAEFFNYAAIGFYLTILGALLLAAAPVNKK